MIPTQHVRDPFARILQRLVEQLAVGRQEHIGLLPFHPAREQGIGVQVAGDIGAAALHHMRGEPLARAAVPLAREVVGQAGEGGIEQAEQLPERLLLAAVRGSGDQDQVPLGFVGQPRDQLEALVAAAPRLARGDAGVGLVHDHQVGGQAQEVVATSVGLHEVGGDDHVAEVVEDRLARPALPLQAGDCAGQHLLRIDVELLGQLRLPLPRKMRRAQHGHPGDLPAVHKLAGDQRRLDRLPYAHIVGDQQPHRVQLQRQQQRHQLVGARLHGDRSEGAEGAGAGAEAQAGSIAQQPPRSIIAQLLGVRQREPRRLHKLQRAIDARDLLLSAAQRTQHQQIVPRSRQYHPLAASRPHQGANCKRHRRHSGVLATAATTDQPTGPTAGLAPIHPHTCAIAVPAAINLRTGVLTGPATTNLHAAVPWKGRRRSRSPYPCIQHAPGPRLLIALISYSYPLPSHPYVHPHIVIPPPQPRDPPAFTPVIRAAPGPATAVAQYAPIGVPAHGSAVAGPRPPQSQAPRQRSSWRPATAVAPYATMRPQSQVPR